MPTQKAKTIKWTEEQKEAIEASIAHWKDDIISRLLCGAKIDKSLLIWDDTGDDVECFADDCLLCNLYGDSERCKECPYVIHYRRRCSDLDQAWWNFVITPTLQTAQEMVRKLEALLVVGCV